MPSKNIIIKSESVLKRLKVPQKSGFTLSRIYSTQTRQNTIFDLKYHVVELNFQL
jgi:hypothetical protein